MRSILGAALAVALLASSSATALAQESGGYDIVIRNGRVLDGAGNPWVRADIAISNGRIAKIGKVTAKGKREIDAKGRYVSPGWIDMMDQSGSVLRVNGGAENKLRTGVTSNVIIQKSFRVPIMGSG